MYHALGRWRSHWETLAVRFQTEYGSLSTLLCHHPRSLATSVSHLSVSFSLFQHTAFTAIWPKYSIFLNLIAFSNFWLDFPFFVIIQFLSMRGAKHPFVHICNVSRRPTVLSVDVNTARLAECRIMQLFHTLLLWTVSYRGYPCCRLVQLRRTFCSFVLLTIDGLSLS